MFFFSHRCAGHKNRRPFGLLGDDSYIVEYCLLINHIDQRPIFRVFLDIVQATIKHR